MHQWQPSGGNAEVKARDILSAAMWLHSTFANRVWLWRGQADHRFGVEPSVHTRVLNSTLSHSEDTSIRATRSLINSARDVKLDHRDGYKLPDLALLANLQHHGAATPLLDVSTDPLIALWMIAFADAKHPARLDDVPGSLFGIARPPAERWIDPMDSREYESIAKNFGDQTWWYRAPDVTERLRIQRGSFLISALSTSNKRGDTTLPVELALDRENFIANRIKSRGKRGNGHLGDIEAFRIAVPAASKKHLRTLLEDRSGLSIEAIYPTPWHQPFIVQFSSAYGRGRRLELDIASP